MVALALVLVAVFQSGLRDAVINVFPWVLPWLCWYGVARLRFERRRRAGIAFDNDDLPAG